MLCTFSVFFFNDTATTEIYTLSLHDALPIYVYTPKDYAGKAEQRPVLVWFHGGGLVAGESNDYDGGKLAGKGDSVVVTVKDRKSTRLNSSHTVISYAVFCLKKKKKKSRNDDTCNIVSRAPNDRLQQNTKHRMCDQNTRVQKTLYRMSRIWSDDVTSCTSYLA